MAKTHLEHPTQATACGTLATQHGKTPEEFESVPKELRCKSCQKTLYADRAERPAYSGIEPAALESRTLSLNISNDLANAIERYIDTDWNDGRDPSKLGALNAACYIGERLVALYRLVNNYP